MSDVFERLNKLSPKRLALLAMDLQSKLDAAERARHEPIAIVGMACRFPGAADPEAYWEVLRDGVDAITEIPRSRWDVDAYYDPDPDAPGKIATRWGGFVDDIDRFEPQIFGISPREALSLDPQQRLLLEVSWEALERSGIAPDSLTGSPTGVFVGVCNGDYAHMLMEGDGADFDMYLATGNAYSVASGRLSYVLGLQGPAISVDTACSSSLLAVHLAVQSLRDGACSMALAGGANAILSPKTTMALSRARMMAPDGRCRPFDAAAAGFVRSEGCGMVVLKRLADAVADGDAVLAVIRGSAANQDGRSNGLTAPNGPSQVAVIRAALADGGVAPPDVSYVETHGTGTSLGDPIEAGALGAALGVDRTPGNRLMIGSTKANVGHLESAAGIAGLIKVVLAMGHREIPPLLHLDRPSPHIPWDDLPIDLPTGRTAWEPAGPTGERLVAGVSSFGFSGTNVHVLLESTPVEPPVPASPAGGLAPRPLDVVTLSARTATALRTMADELAGHLAARPELALADVAHTLGVGRSTFAHRLGLVAADGKQAATTLAAFAADEVADGVVTGVVSGTRRPDVVFLFTGHGAQYPDMGRGLYDTQPVFRDAIDTCAALLEPLMDAPLLDVLYDDRDGGSPLLADMASSQPALFAVEHALATLWRSWGVEPAAVAGHSAGEYVAAVVAGVMSLEDGLRLIAARGRLMSSLPADGEMAAVFATEARVREAIAPHGQLLSIAAVNGPESIAISGDRASVRTVVAELRADGIEVRPLAIPIAAHSPQVDPILDAFEAVAATVAFRAPRLDVISGVHGRLAEGDDLMTARYWRRHLRQPVRFADALEAAYAGGRRVFLEVGPHPTLLGIARHVLPEHECAWLPSLRSGHDDWDQILRSVAGLFVAGGSVDWARFDQPTNRRRVELPTYPFERERYWAVGPTARRAGPTGVGGHPLLGHRLLSPALTDIAFETTLGATWPAYLDHHRIYGVALLPSPAFVEMALAAAGEALGAGPWTIEDLSIREALILPDDGERTVQIVVDVDGPGAGFEVFSAGDRPGDGWTLHATGRLAPGLPPADLVVAFDAAAIQDRCATRIDGPTYYAELFDLGLEFGESFRGLTEIWRRDGEALGRVVLPEVLAGDTTGYTIHPALLDACFHLLGAPLPTRDDEVAYLLIAIDELRLHAPPGRQLWNHTVLRPGYDEGGDSFVGDVTLFTDDGALVAEVRGLHLRLAGRSALLRATRRDVDEWLYDVDWQPRELVVPAGTAAAATVPELLGPLATRAEGLAGEHDLAGWRRFVVALDELAVSATVEALRALGWEPSTGDHVVAAELAAALGVVPAHHRLFRRLLELVAGAGVLDGHGDPWVVGRGLPAPVDVAAAAAAIGSRSAVGAAELALTARCGTGLADVLRGTVDPLELLFPGGSQETAERIYRDAPLAGVTNTLVHDVVAAAVADLPTDRTVRILEVGGGTGATTDAVLAGLPRGRAEYCFTDVSPLFVARADERYADAPTVRTEVLDIERDPIVPAGGHYDIVIAANVVHATADLRAVLGNLRSLLAPGGLLVLVEGTRPAAWVDITFGLTAGWWRFADTDLRPEHPLLDRHAWLATLAAAGFDQTATLPPIDAPDLDGQAVVVARAAAGPLAAGTPSWLLLTDSGGVADALAERLRRDGDHVELLATTTTVEPDGRADTADLTARIAALPPGPRHLVHLSGLDLPAVDGLDADAVGRAPAVALSDALAMAQAAAGSSAPTTMWIVTRGAQPAAGVVPTPLPAPLWGLGRVIALEQPERWGGLVDLAPDGTPDDDAEALLAELRHGDGEDQVAVRPGGRLVARLVRATPPDTGSSFTPRADASYLITGGLGGLGLKIARWLAEGGAGAITLLGRRGLPERSEWDALPDASREAAQVAAIRDVEALGATVHVVAADVADRTAMQAVVARFGADRPPLRGVVHAAAELSNWSIAEMPHPALHAMLAPKVTGTWVLHELTADLELDAFVLFSSTTALWGSRDLGHYAAANQFLDAFAHHRRSTGRPALSINWGTWDEIRVASAAEQRMVSSSGLDPMPADQALRTMGELLAADVTQVAVAAVDWDTLKAVYESRRARPFLSLVASRRGPERARSGGVVRQELVERLREADDDERYDVVVRYLLDEVARTLGMTTVDDIDVGQGLFEMGMDSLMAVELKSRIGLAVGATLPSTLTFNYPTIEALGGYLMTEVLAERDDRAAAVAPDATVETPAAVTPAGAALDDLSEDDLAAMLAARLARP